MIWKKILLTFLLFFIFHSCGWAESVVTSLIIDGADEREIEVVMHKERMYLPCKYILSFFEIPFSENHVDKSLSFLNAIIQNNYLIIDGKKQGNLVFFEKNGITGLKNEYFLPAEELSKITGKKITADSKQLMAFIKTKEVTAQNTFSDENPFLVKSSTEKIQANEQLSVPKQKGWISLDSVGVRNNVMTDSYAQVYRESEYKTAMLNNNSQVTFCGKLFSGDYKVDMGTNTYTNNLFAFSGMNPQYKNRIGNYDYLVGKLDNWDFGTNNLGSDIMGFQLKNHVEKKLDYKSIEGYVAPTSIVKVYINNDFEKELSTFGGYYSLRDVYYNAKVEKVRVEEIMQDGTRKEVLVKNFTGDCEKKSIPKKDFILGVTGLQNRLWANNGYIYQTNTKKLVLGFKQHNQISDKVSYDHFILADKITENPMDGVWGQSVFSNRKYLNFTTMHNLNMVEGQTYAGLLNYEHDNGKVNDKFSFGVSNSTSQDTITPAGTGFFLRYDNDREFNPETAIKSSIFAYSPNFYSAGSSSGGGSFLSDRVGTSLSGNTKIKNTTLTGTYSKYSSNFDNFYDGGLINFEEYNFMARTYFKKLPSISFRANSKSGANELGKISSNSFELSANKRFKCFNIDAGVRKNNYSNIYNSEGFSSYSSDYSNTYTDVSFPLGKKFGYASVGHEDVKTSSDTTQDNYKVIKFSYSLPTIKNINTNFMVGYHYTGLNKGSDLGFGIMKRLKSGSTVSLNYRFNQTPCYIIDNMYIPSSMRHSVTLDFAELYGLSDLKFQPIGTNNAGKGFVQVLAFLDVNQNGIQDKGEPNIENIPIKIEDDSESFVTTKDGNTKLKPESVGVHKVELYENELPTFLSCHNKTNPSRFLKVEENQTTQVAFGLVSSVGNINGTVTIKNEYNAPVFIPDMIVSVLDSTGKEVNYTNINEDGTFSLSGLNPGKYTVMIDKSLQDAYHIAPEADSKNLIIEIPPEYNDYVNIDNVNLNYKYQI